MTKFPGYEKICFLKDPLSDRPMRGEIPGKIDTFALTRGEVELSAPIQVSWYMGGGLPSDFIWTGNAGAVIVHRCIVNLLRDQGFTGWRPYVVSVIDKGGDYHPEYDGLVILGRCGAADLSTSVVVLSQYPAGWYPHLLGYYFPADSWDGSDIFMERPDTCGHQTGHTFVTDRLRAAFEAANVQNVRFEPLPDHSAPSSVYEIGSGHRVPEDFPARVSAAYRRAGVDRPNQQNRE